MFVTLVSDFAVVARGHDTCTYVCAHSRYHIGDVVGGNYTGCFTIKESVCKFTTSK